MNVSQKRIEANRRNAKKSTGPRTPEGKARVSQNALKHGLYATKPILNVSVGGRLPVCPIRRARRKRAAHSNALTTELCPATKLERLLVRRLANFAWQLDRAEKIATMEAKPFAECPNCTQSDAAQPQAPATGGTPNPSAHDDNHTRQLTLLVRRLCARLERTFGAIHSVKKSRYPDIVAELERSLTNGGEDTEKDSPLERVI
jgi:hypothetical protein